MSAEEWRSVFLTLLYSVLGVLCALPPAVALGWLLARKRWPGRALVETIAMLPLVLPPVVTGLLLLKILGRRGPVGGWLYQNWGIEIVFTWKAVVAALAVMVFPLMLRSIRTAFEEVPRRYERLARTLGAGEWRVFFSITLPLARRGLAAGLVLGMARALGEFGATMLVAGFVRNETSTISLLIYHAVQLGHDAVAWRLAAVSGLLAFTTLWIATKLEPGRNRHDA